MEARFVPADHLGIALDEVAAAKRAHLSVRHAVSAAVALDHLPDRVFGCYRESAPDKLQDAPDLPHYRSLIHRACPALAALHRLCTFSREGPQLLRHPVPVTPERLVQLDIADFMVCLYSGQSVETIMLRESDGGERVFSEVLAEAAGWWKAEFAEREL